MIYLMQSMKLHENDFKKINATLFKFIWNRYYQSAKAPERIKREIMYKQVNKGGFGMINVAELDASLKIKAVGRMLATKHPYILLIKNKVRLDNFFEPRCTIKIDGMAIAGLEELTGDRHKLWAIGELSSNRDLLLTIKKTKIRDVLSTPGKNSIAYFMLSRTKMLIGDLTRADLRLIERYIEEVKLDKIRKAIDLRIMGEPRQDFNSSFFTQTNFKPLVKCTSKEIRTARIEKLPITEFKLGISLEVAESLSWGHKITKLTSISHRCTLLRVAHAEVYTKERMHRFGLRDSSTCPRCDESENLNHKIYECEYIKRIWRHYASLIGKPINREPCKYVLGMHLNETIADLTARAEILQRILYLRDDQSYLIHPKAFVQLSLKGIIKREVKSDIKEHLTNLLRD